MRTTALFVVSAVLFGLVSATPTANGGNDYGNQNQNTNNHSGSNSCGSNQFWYSARSCCLTHGGPPSKPAPPRGRDCPSSWYWHSGQGCCTPSHPTQPSNPQPSCTGRFTWSKGSQCCEEHGSPPTTSKPPTPSQTPHRPHNYARNAPHVNKIKRNHVSQAATFCPRGLEACPVSGLTGTNEYECVDALEDLNSCGGCASTGAGQDCSAIPHAWNVGCMIGKCSVYTCAPGFKVSTSGNSCVAL